MTTTKSKLPKLAGFEPLSDLVWDHEPAAPASSDSPLIVVAAWMGAGFGVLNKYTSKIIELFPHSHVIVVTCSAAAFFTTSAATHATSLQPALDRIIKRPSATPLVSVVYSNGGLLSIAGLASGYNLATKDPLPLQTLILDSAPGSNDLSAAHAAFYNVLPPSVAKGFLPIRYTASALLWLGLYTMVAGSYVLGSVDSITRLRALINDSSLFATNTNRIYIYSKQDKIVPWEAVESSAKDAKSAGWRTEIHELAGGHVDHARAEPERYWNIISEGLKG